MAKKIAVENELISGLKEVLDHKRGRKRLSGRRLELSPSVPEWRVPAKLKIFVKVRCK